MTSRLTNGLSGPELPTSRKARRKLSRPSYHPGAPMCWHRFSTGVARIGSRQADAASALRPHEACKQRQEPAGGLNGMLSPHCRTVPHPGRSADLSIEFRIFPRRNVASAMFCVREWLWIFPKHNQRLRGPGSFPRRPEDADARYSQPLQFRFWVANPDSISHLWRVDRHQR